MMISTSPNSQSWSGLEHGSEFRIDQNNSNEDVEIRDDGSDDSLEELLRIVEEAKSRLVDPADAESKIEPEQPERDESSFVARTPTKGASLASRESSISVKGQSPVTGNSLADPNGGVGPTNLTRPPTPRLLDGRFAIRHSIATRSKQSELLRTVLDRACKQNIRTTSRTPPASARSMAPPPVLSKVRGAGTRVSKSGSNST